MSQHGCGWYGGPEAAADADGGDADDENSAGRKSPQGKNVLFITDVLTLLFSSDWKLICLFCLCNTGGKKQWL